MLKNVYGYLLFLKILLIYLPGMTHKQIRSFLRTTIRFQKKTTRQLVSDLKLCSDFVVA